MAKLFARLGAGFASAAFLFDTFFAVCNPGGGLGIGIAFIRSAIFILYGFAIVPVLFFTGTREMKMPIVTVDDIEKTTYMAIEKCFALLKGKVPDEELRLKDLEMNKLRARDDMKVLSEKERKGEKIKYGWQMEISQAWVPY